MLASYGHQGAWHVMEGGLEYCYTEPCACVRACVHACVRVCVCVCV